MSIMKVLCGTLSASVVRMRVNILSVRPTVASAAGTNDLLGQHDMLTRGQLLAQETVHTGDEALATL